MIVTLNINIDDSRVVLPVLQMLLGKQETANSDQPLATAPVSPAVCCDRCQDTERSCPAEVLCGGSSESS